MEFRIADTFTDSLAGAARAPCHLLNALVLCVQTGPSGGEESG
jgi:hypothetical protein